MSPLSTRLLLVRRFASLHFSDVFCFAPSSDKLTRVNPSAPCSVDREQGHCDVAFVEQVQEPHEIPVDSHEVVQ